MRRLSYYCFLFHFWDFSDRCRSLSLSSSFGMPLPLSLSSRSLMRVLGVLEPIDLLAALQFMRRRSHLAVGTTIAGATPIDATL